MRCLVATRFSVLDYGFKGYALTRTARDEAACARALFNPERLDFKLSVFEAVTAPSVLAQTWQDYEWNVYTAATLPMQALERLRGAVASNPHARIVQVSDMEEAWRDLDCRMEAEAEVATLRLDDDDALHREFLAELQRHAHLPEGTVVSFPRGRTFTFDGGLVRGPQVSRRNHAQGMAALGSNVFRCGNHSTVHLRHPVVYDEALEDAYLLCCSEFCDTRRRPADEEEKPAKRRKSMDPSPACDAAEGPGARGAATGCGNPPEHQDTWMP